MCVLSIKVPIRKSLETYLIIIVCTNNILYVHFNTHTHTHTHTHMSNNILPCQRSWMSHLFQSFSFYACSYLFVSMTIPACLDLSPNVFPFICIYKGHSINKVKYCNKNHCLQWHLFFKEIDSDESFHIL